MLDGIEPNSLAQTQDGTLYGTTSLAGPDSPTGEAFGTIFRVTLDGQFRTLYTFTTAAVGGGPNGLVAAPDGNLYGTTFFGGTSGAGSIFRVTPAGSLTVLHSFNTKDGDAPSGILKLNSSNEIYGTTLGGGLATSPSFNGSLFEINMAGNFRFLYLFRGSPASAPFDVMQTANGDYYGLTQGGGAHDGGVLYKLSVAP